MKLGQKIILSFFIVILLVIIVLQVVIYQQKNLVKEYVSNNAENFKKDWQISQANTIRTLAMSLELIAQDETLKSVYLEKNRKKLYRHTEYLSETLLNKYLVDNFHFILPDGHCFARIFDKDSYGDLVNIPFNLKNLSDQDIVSGLMNNNGNLIIRSIKPYYMNNDLIGYLEVGQSLELEINNITNERDRKIVIVAKKRLITEKTEPIINFLGDKNQSIGKTEKFTIVASSLPEKYTSLLEQGIEKALTNISETITVVPNIFQAENQQFVLCSFALKDLQGDNIGAVLAFLDITQYMETLNKVKYFALKLMLLLCGIVTIVGITIMNSILSPIAKLTYATAQVGKGNLDISFQDKAKDEISFLGQAFNKMVQDLKATTTSVVKLNQEIAEREKTEKALRSEKNKAERYFDIAGVMFVALNAQGEVSLVNKKSCEILEQAEQEIIGKNWFENFIPSGGEANKVFEQLMSGETRNVEYHENEIKTAKGGVRYISWHNSILKDDNGAIIGTFSSGQDITERLEAEQSLKASEENYKKLTQELAQGQEATLNILEDLQEAKGTLEISRQNFLNIIEKSTDSILIVDDNGLVKFANTSAILLFGRSSEKMIDSSLGLDIKKYGVQETTITRPDGSYKIADMRAVNTEWEEKTMTLVLLHDITERKQAEDALRIAAQEWRVTFDSIGNGLSLLDLDSKIVRCNKALSNLVNKSFAEIIGQDCHDLIHGQDSEEHCPIRQTLKTKKRSTRVIKKEDKWLSISVDPLLSEQNELIGLVHSVTDLTDQKIIEQKLREYTDYVENIIETAQAFIVGFDRNLNIQTINTFAENLTGHNRDDIIGHDWLELLMPAEYRDEVIQVLSNCLEGERVKGYEIPVLSKENKEVMISWDSAELRDADGKITGLVVMGYDVSQRKEIEKVQRLAQLGTLVSHMAHEVNNPLMVISGRAQLSLMEDIQNPEVKANLDIVMKECQRAKDIIQRLLRFSRPSKGELKLTDVNASLVEVVNLVEHQFGLNNVHIKKDYAPNLPPLMVDEKQIHEVFMNLLTNAQDAIAGEGTIKIKSQKEGKFIKITFTDSGEGITKEVLDKIFDPFFTTKKKGTGLGLSICYSIIKAHNGDLRFESVPGHGASAIIMLPYMQENIDV
ncbi:MAG: PAS domain S-box protein [Candidatus Omnitrophota bacterium]